MEFFYAMNITVNGQQRITDAGTIGDLLRELSISPLRVAVEVNLRVIRRSDLDSHPLREGDTVEIVNFVGGGQHNE